MAVPYSPETMDAARRLLVGAGLNASPEATRLAAGWVQSEGGLQFNNPLNTTLRAPGRTGSVNSVGVGRFADLNAGVDANVKTLAHDRYAGIRAALAAGDEDQFVQAVGSSPWGTSSDLLGRVLRTTPVSGTAAPAAPPPVKPAAARAVRPVQPSVASVDVQDASLRGQFAVLARGGKIRPIDLLTGGMMARSEAEAANAQHAADLARQVADEEQDTNPVAPTTPTAAGGVNPPDPDAKGASAATSFALNNLGIPYSWGGGTPSGPSKGIGRGAGTTGYDCSAFVQAALARAGVKLPRTTYDQIKMGQPVQSLAQAKPGDLIFPSTGHVGLYLGNGQMAEAPYTGAVTRVKNIVGMRPVAIRRVL